MRSHFYLNKMTVFLKIVPLSFVRVDHCAPQAKIFFNIYRFLKKFLRKSPTRNAFSLSKIALFLKIAPPYHCAPQAKKFFKGR